MARPSSHVYSLSVTSIRGRDRYQAVCQCGEAGPYRSTEDMAEADWDAHARRGGTWPSADPWTRQT